MGEEVGLCLPSAGRKTQFFHHIITQPGKSLLEIPCTIYHPSRSPPISLDSARCPSSLTRSSSMATISLSSLCPHGDLHGSTLSRHLWTVFMTFTFTEINHALVILSSPLSDERANFAKTECSSNQVYAFAGKPLSLSLPSSYVQGKPDILTTKFR